jgi:hypothetical protein
MDKAMIAKHLAIVERHVTEGQRHIDRQREIVRELQRDGRDPATAMSLLRQFEDMQTLHIQDRDRLRSELL